MKKARLFLCALVASMAFVVSACNSVTAFDEGCPPDGIPGPDTICE